MTHIQQEAQEALDQAQDSLGDALNLLVDVAQLMQSMNRQMSEILEGDNV